jgi:hypothetical protein
MGVEWLRDDWFRGNWGPHLVVVPTSVMLNWEVLISFPLPARAPRDTRHVTEGGYHRDSSQVLIAIRNVGSPCERRHVTHVKALKTVTADQPSDITMTVSEKVA